MAPSKPTGVMPHWRDIRAILHVAFSPRMWTLVSLVGLFLAGNWSAVVTFSKSFAPLLPAITSGLRSIAASGLAHRTLVADRLCHDDDSAAGVAATLAAAAASRASRTLIHERLSLAAVLKAWQ